MPDLPLTPAVLAADLRALADGPFDAATVRMLERAADLIDPGVGAVSDTETPTGSHEPAAVGVSPRSLDDLTGSVEAALDLAALQVDVWETDARGERLHTSPLVRLVRCLRSAGLLDEGDLIPLPALRALAAGEPVAEVADEHGCDPDLAAEVAGMLDPRVDSPAAPTAGAWRQGRRVPVDLRAPDDG